MNPLWLFVGAVAIGAITMYYFIIVKHYDKPKDEQEAIERSANDFWEGKR